MHGAEALRRWRHPGRGPIPPAEFIPVAEECGLIGTIGAWVMREACRQARAWQRAGLPPLRVAVNLSPSQFRQGNIVAMIRDALDEAGLEPRFLEVELTETTVMTDPEESIAILERLSHMGRRAGAVRSRYQSHPKQAGDLQTALKPRAHPRSPFL